MIQEIGEKERRNTYTHTHLFLSWRCMGNCGGDGLRENLKFLVFPFLGKEKMAFFSQHISSTVTEMSPIRVNKKTFLGRLKSIWGND